MKEEMVTISKKKYEILLIKEKVLTLLREKGVDNWEWYGEAMEELTDEEFSASFRSDCELE